jgi:pimeloyl-ACP methyl ester carboxylesterase
LPATVDQEIAPGVTGVAGYTEGASDTSPVLILHGFLQTNEFPTVTRLAESLADSDYTILTPTLSLGITERRQSQSCEALHLQTLDDDVSEIAQWVNWLYHKRQREVTLIGHSAGGHVITRYLHDYPEAPVGQVILISLSYPTGSPLGADSPNPQAIVENELGFCQRYPTTVKAYRSYVEWGPEQMLSEMHRIKGRLSVILGSEDKRIPPSWVDTMRKGGIRITTVEGANHFFDSAHEFDLEEVVENLLGPQD